MPYTLDPPRCKQQRASIRTACNNKQWRALAELLNNYPAHYHMPCFLWESIKWIIDIVRTDCRYCHAMRVGVIAYCIGRYFG